MYGSEDYNRCMIFGWMHIPEIWKVYFSVEVCSDEAKVIVFRKFMKQELVWGFMMIVGRWR